jgi:hypothetical protein
MLLYVSADSYIFMYSILILISPDYADWLHDAANKLKVYYERRYTRVTVPLFYLAYSTT